MTPQDGARFFELKDHIRAYTRRLAGDDTGRVCCCATCCGERVAGFFARAQQHEAAAAQLRSLNAWERVREGGTP